MVGHESTGSLDVLLVTHYCLNNEKSTMCDVTEFSYISIYLVQKIQATYLLYGDKNFHVITMQLQGQHLPFVSLLPGKPPA